MALSQIKVMLNKEEVESKLARTIKLGRQRIKLNSLGFSSIDSQFQNLLGKVLTVVDSSISGERQNKAMKDLIRSKFYEQINWVSELCGVDITTDSSSTKKSK